MIITIQVDTENSKDIEKAMAMLHGLGGPTAQRTDEDEGERMLNILLLERVSVRASNIVGSFMGRNPGVIKTIHDLRRIVQSGKLRGSGCGPKTRVELSEEIEKILAE